MQQQPEQQTLTVRLKGRGPVGSLRTEVPCSLATLRQQMREQKVPASLPDGSEDYRFLTGGVPVSLVQEGSEAYQEGDVLIASLPPGVSAATASAADNGAQMRQPVRSPAQTLVSQWVDAFDFMCDG